VPAGDGESGRGAILRRITIIALAIRDATVPLGMLSAWATSSRE